MKKREIERKVSGFEERLGVKFPQSYRQFLLEEAPTEVAGFQILGLPGKEEKEGKEKKLSLKESLAKLAQELEEIRKRIEGGKAPFRRIKTSILEATLLLRKMRPDLSKKLVVISFHPFKDKVLCLDTESGALLETTLKTKKLVTNNQKKVVFLFLLTEIFWQFKLKVAT